VGVGMSALLSFLGGSVFRMIWGEMSAWWSKKQDHEHEIERMRVENELADRAHSRNLESIKLQADMNIKVIGVQAEAGISQTEADGWLEAVKGTTKVIGVKFIDAWNAGIRPLVATWALAMLTLHIAQNGWVLDDYGWQICGAALGIYLADRTLAKRGK